MKAEALRWQHPVWDVAGFALGLGLAWQLQWQTRDLVWGLWLSSLVLGYASIVLGLAGAARRASETGGKPGLTFGLVGAGLLLAFFTVHFGGFHFVHSIFLNFFFPIEGVAREGFGPGLGGYAQVVVLYWPWLLAALLAERGALLDAWLGRPPPGKPAKPGPLSFDPSPAYVNVARMHLLIFFFAFVSFAQWDHFLVYAVVYAVYFFPWRLLRRTAEPVRG